MITYPKPVPISAAQESVWDYPRPPALRESDKHVRVIFDGQELAASSAAICILETSHPPSYYLPPADVDQTLLLASQRSDSFCEWKGLASYFDVVSTGESAVAAVWSYASPGETYAAIGGYYCFYAQSMDACYVGEDKVTPQPGGFYGGWVTPDIVGPFKGIPGSNDW